MIDRSVYQNDILLERDRAATREAHNQVAQSVFFDLIKRYGVKTIVSCSELSTNPFVFEGQVIATVIDFGQMLERDKALFGEQCIIVASGVPSRTFSTRQASVVLVGTVIGTTSVNVPFGTIPAPHLRFVNAHFCQQRNCAEFRPR